MAGRENISTAVMERSGMTLLEVLLAVVIVSMVTTVFLRFLVSGERIRGRGMLISHAAVIAGNEAERIKSAAAGTGLIITDTAYEADAGGRTFIVERRAIESRNSQETVIFSDCQEIEISVRKTESDSPLVRFRLIQGNMQ